MFDATQRCSLAKAFVFLSDGDFGQELFCEECHAFVILQTKGENWDRTEFKMGVDTGCSEYSECTLTTDFFTILP